MDEHLDLSGKIATSVAGFQRWLGDQTGGRRLRVDNYQRELDITFFRLSRSDAAIRNYNAYVRDQIEAELKQAGFEQPNKLYVVYYGGTSNYSCGGGAWPPDLSGNVAAMYLYGTPPGAPACATNILGSSETNPGYFEFGMLHEILHTLGFVATCAPHQTLRGHVSDSSSDLMYAGPSPWKLPPVLDIGRDDYYGHSLARCPDFITSPYLGP